VETGFANVFKAARPGSSGEAFALDADGWLISESRHGDELRRRGLVADTDSGVFPLRLLALDPNAGPDATPRLTRLAVTAIAARHEDESRRAGVLLDPYPGYLGREVIGAWRWLAELDLGVAVEMDAVEAYAPLHYLQIAFMVLLALILLVWLSVFVPTSAFDHLLRRSPSRQIGPYRVVRQIGAGAISNVYLAEHRLLKRPVALKVLKPQSSSDEWIARFEREVQSTSLLRHPNTITIYDYGSGPNGLFYYAMEYLEGLSLAELVERYGPVPPARTAHILRQACASLWEAHSCGLVHRDIKPQNIMLCKISGECDVVKVLDFGLVKQVSGAQTRDLTGTLRILGTPLYMSPERIRNPADADARADIYALGAVGFFLADRAPSVRDRDRARFDLSRVARAASAGFGLLALCRAGGARCPDRTLPGKGSGGTAADHRASGGGARCPAGARAMDAAPDRCLVGKELDRGGQPGAALSAGQAGPGAPQHQRRRLLAGRQGAAKRLR